MRIIALAVLVFATTATAQTTTTVKTVAVLKQAVLMVGSDVSPIGNDLVYPTMTVLGPPRSLREGEASARWILDVWRVNCRSRKLTLLSSNIYADDNSLIREEAFDLARPLDGLSQTHFDYVCFKKVDAILQNAPVADAKIALMAAIAHLDKKNAATAP